MSLENKILVEKEILEVSKEIIDVSKEEVLEDIKETMEEISKTLSETLLDVINENKEILEVPLTNEAKNILIHIINLKSSIFDDIETTLLEVVKNNKTESTYMPHFIILIQKLYEIIYGIKDIKLDSKKRALVCAELLKFVSHYLVIERRVKIEENENEKEFLEQIDKLIDSCIGLLRFTKDIKSKGCVSSFLKNFKR